MRRARLGLALTMVAGALFAGGVDANAATVAGPDSSSPLAVGNVRPAVPASQTGFLNVESRQGYMCGWSGNAPDWSVDPQAGANCLNNDIWIANNGYIENFDCVDLYWGTHYTGATAFISQGDAWDLTGNQFVFDYPYNVTLPGMGQSLLNNVGSSYWTDQDNCNRFG